jgi:branched-chain amino acid transport system permease protein
MVRARAVATQTGTVILVLIAVYAFLLFLKATGISEVNFDRQQVANGIGVGAIYGSVALALVLIYRSTGVVNFAQGEMAMFSTFFAWSLIVDQKITFWLGFAIVLVLAAILGTVVQRVVIKPVENAPLLTVIIVTLGLLQIFNSSANFIWQSQPKAFPTPFGRGSFNIFGASVGKPTVGTIAVMLVVMALVFCFFNYTKVGLASRAAAQNPLASRLCGVPVSWMLTIGWALASVVGAAAGMLVANTLSLDPNMMIGVLLYAFAAAVLGGLDNPVGAVVGGFVVGIVQNVVVGADLLKGIPDAVAFVVIVLVLVIRPTGLLGRRVVAKV